MEKQDMAKENNIGVHKIFGKILRSKRLELGWSISELSKRSGVTTVSLYNFEKCKTPYLTVPVLAKIGKAFNTPISALVGDTDLEKAPKELANFYNKYNEIEKLDSNQEKLVMTIIRRLAR